MYLRLCQHKINNYILFLYSYQESSNDRANMIPSYTPPVLNNSKLDTPPWLQEPSNSAKGGSATAASNLEEGKATEEPSSEVPRMILYTRIINLVLSVCMIIVSLLALLTTQSATTGVLACYLTVFACLLCCFETHLKQVSKIIALNFGFMYSARARSVFMLFLGSFSSRQFELFRCITIHNVPVLVGYNCLCILIHSRFYIPKSTIFVNIPSCFIPCAGSILFSFSLFGKIVAVCMIANALFNMYILFKYPEYEAVQRQDAQSDIKVPTSTSTSAFLRVFLCISQRISPIAVTERNRLLEI